MSIDDSHIDKRPRLDFDDEFSFSGLSFLDGESPHGDWPVHDVGDRSCSDHSGHQGSSRESSRHCPFGSLSPGREMGSMGDDWLQDGSATCFSSVSFGSFLGDVDVSNSPGIGLLPDTGVEGALPIDADNYLGELGDDVPNTEARDFRLQGKCFHFTYRGFILPESIFTLFGGVSKFQWYSIVHETGHSGTEYEHTHVYCRFHSKINKRGPRCCDIDGVHPHIKFVKSKLHEGRIYHLYHRGYKGDKCYPPVAIWQSKEGPADPSLSTNRDRMLELIHRGSLLDAALGFGVEIRSISDIKAIREEKKPAEPAEANFPKEAFTLQINWSHSFRGKLFDTCCVLLYGGAGLGKTECAIAHFERCLLVRSLDQARDFNELRYDGIVFDDCSLVHLSAEERIHLADYTQPSVIKARYSNGYIPKNIKRIFTTNKTPEEYWRLGTNMTDEQYEGIRRRVKFIHVVTSTY